MMDHHNSKSTLITMKEDSLWGEKLECFCSSLADLIHCRGPYFIIDEANSKKNCVNSRTLKSSIL